MLIWNWRLRSHKRQPVAARFVGLQHLNHSLKRVTATEIVSTANNHVQ
jgi:hypothetical protein